MFLHLNHQKLATYRDSLDFVVESYRFTKSLPAEERFNLIQQIRRAATSVHLNISEGCSRRSAVEKKRFFEISRGLLIEIDAALDVSTAPGYCAAEPLTTLGHAMVACFVSLTGLINSVDKKQ